MLTPLIQSRTSRAVALAVAIFSFASCGSELTRTSRSPMVLVIDKIEASKGTSSASSSFAANLVSDVQTLVDVTVNGVIIKVATVFNDTGRATIRLVPKDPGTTANPTAPSALNAVTITRYHVNFVRSDGRNVPGVDVPYGFDGATTMTLSSSSASDVVFDAVRHTNKEEPPLINLINGGGARFINAIVQVTFYGRDQAGNEIVATGSFDVVFGDFADN